MEMMGKKLDGFKIHHFRRIIVMASFFLVLVVGVIYWQVDLITQKVLINRIQDEKLIVARAGSKAVADYFSARKVELLLLNDVEAVRRGEKESGSQTLKNVLERVGDSLLVDVVRIDKEGKIIFAASGAEGEFVSDRKYFLWAKKQISADEVYLSEPVVARGGPTEGKIAMVMASPIFNLGESDGAVIMVFDLEDLTQRFIKPLTLSGDDQITLIDESGQVVTSSFIGSSGENIFDLIGKDNWQGQEEFMVTVEDSLKGNEGRAIVPYLVPTTKEVKRAIAVYTPIKIDGLMMTLWVLMPYKKAINLVMPLLKAQTLGIIIGLTVIVFFILVLIFGVRVAQRDGFVDGFRDGRDGVKKGKK
jgi:hypothetical protein